MAKGGQPEEDEAEVLRVRVHPPRAPAPAPSLDPGRFIFLARNIGNRALYYSEKLTVKAGLKCFIIVGPRGCYYFATSPLNPVLSLHSVPTFSLVSAVARSALSGTFDAKKLTMRNCLAKSCPLPLGQPCFTSRYSRPRRYALDTPIPVNRGRHNVSVLSPASLPSCPPGPDYFESAATNAYGAADSSRSSSTGHQRFSIRAEHFASSSPFRYCRLLFKRGTGEHGNANCHRIRLRNNIVEVILVTGNWY